MEQSEASRERCVVGWPRGRSEMCGLRMIVDERRACVVDALSFFGHSRVLRESGQGRYMGK